MHDPCTVAFSIRRPWKDGHYGFRPSWVDIWHVDPQKDGTDDSCGWFKRARHGDKKVRDAIRNDFAFEWDPSYGGWFNANGAQLFSTIAITLGMFQHAAWVHFGKNMHKRERFMRRRLWDIIYFSENPTDSMASLITGRYGVDRRDDRIDSAVSIVYGCILRWEQPWWRHPRWHVHHWRISLPGLQPYWRWLFGERCAACGGRIGPAKECPVQVGRRLYHGKCSGIGVAANMPPIQKTSEIKHG